MGWHFPALINPIRREIASCGLLKLPHFSRMSGLLSSICWLGTISHFSDLCLTIYQVCVFLLSFQKFDLWLTYDKCNITMQLLHQTIELVT